MKRRELFAAAGCLAAVVAGMRVQLTRAADRLRPPGARAADDFERLCIRCFRCAEVCPPRAIRFESTLDPRTSDMPYIVARESACTLCMQCTEVCPTGALEPIPAERREIQQRVKLGRVELDDDKCLTWSGKGVCRLCYYVCPYPDEAVRLVGPKLMPTVDDSRCVGCGLCEEACPEVARAITVRSEERS